MSAAFRDTTSSAGALFAPAAHAPRRSQLHHHQGLRKGEIASQRWERISVDGAAEHDWAEVAWGNQSDWSGQVWLGAESWGNDTKNGQDRVQPLIPMAARLLYRWWVAKERPSPGLILSAVDAMPRGEPLGELARFVARFPKRKPPTESLGAMSITMRQSSGRCFFRPSY